MKNKIFLTTIIFIFVLITFPVTNAENKPDIEWSKTYGESYIWFPCNVQQTSDEGYIVFGTSQNTDYYNQSTEVVLLKVNKDGNEEWNKTYGGISYYHQCNFGIQSNDGGFVIVASTMSELAERGSGWLIKTDGDGNEQWNNTYGISNSLDDGNQVLQTNDGGYIIAGSTEDGGLLLKVDVSGELEWRKTYSKGVADWFFSVDQTIDDGYIMTGYTRPTDSFDLWLLKTDKNGTKEWDKSYDGGSWDWGYSVLQTADEGYIIAGYTTIDGDFNCLLIKTDKIGNEEWDKNLGGEKAKSVIMTNDAGFMVAGYSDESGSKDIYIVKTDENGNIEWNMSFDGGRSDEGYYAQQTQDNGYIVVGEKGYYSIWLIKLGEDNYTSNEGVNDDNDDIIQEVKDDAKTPGFEAILVIYSIIILLVYSKNKK